jgi:hypothetical protein
MQETGFVNKREGEEFQDRYQEMCAKYDKQIRELRTQINMKGKDLQNQRDEISDLETRL